MFVVGGGALWKFLSDSGNTSYGEKWNKDQRSLFKEELKKRRCLSGAGMIHLKVCIKTGKNDLDSGRL